MPPQRRRKTKTTVRKAPFVVILIFMVMGIIGISLDEPRRVLEQAVQVCLSCIGVG